MLAREDLEIKDRADRLLREGKPADALPLYTSLLRQVTVFEGGVYETWLEGALGAYQALGRKREAGYVLMALRQFAEAERCFDPARSPHEWALCAVNLGRSREAARVLAGAGLLTLAAMAFESGGDFAGARQLWEQILADDRLRPCPYETALVHFNLGQALRRLGDAEAARRQMARTQQMLEELADEFETRGERERAFDCYGTLLRLGKDTGSFENVAEGYLSSIRLLAADDQKATVLQYYEDFLDFASAANEWHAAATLAREAADFSLKAGLAYDRHYRQRAASLWNEAARHNAATGGPVELSESALIAAIDCASASGDLPIVGRLYAALADLPLQPAKKERYAALATRYRGGSSPPSGPAFPDHLRRRDAYQDVWRQDLVEWELAGQPTAVLVQLVADRLDYAPSARQALRALLIAADERFSLEDPGAGAELALALARVQAYEILRPLERLAAHPAPRVRAAALGAAAQVYHKRSFGMVRRGLDDEDEGVRAEALRAMRSMRFRDAVDPLSRIFRDRQEETIKLAAVEAIAEIRSVEAGLFLLELVRHESGALFELAARRLRGFPVSDLWPAVRHAASIESGRVKEALDGLLATANAPAA